MSPIHVQQYRCYAADKRTSMDVFANSLGDAFRQKNGTDENQTNDINVSQFQPSSVLETFSDNRFVMRYLRYWQYSRLVNDLALQKPNIDIHHVLDHGYAHLQPQFLNAKSCSSVHDLIPMLRWLGLIEGQAQRKPWLNIKSLSYLSRYDQLVAISQSTKQDLMEHLKLPEDKIEVIYPVLSHDFKPVSSSLSSDFAQRYGLSRDCHWLMISGREYYKNHDTCLAVFKQLIEESDLNIRLIKTGLPSPDFDKQVCNLGLQQHVTQLFLQQFSELPLLYNFVDCLLFPSLYEGFGMPVAEALACGTPVVTSNRGSLPEVGGALAKQCDALDVDGLSQLVLTVLADETIKETLLQDGPLWCDQFRAPTITDKYQKLYSSMLS